MPRRRNTPRHARARRTARPAAGTAPPQPGPDPRDPRLPPWAPAEVDLKFVPPEVRQAADRLVQPVYEACVLGAEGPLERSLGVTLSHLLWLEVLDQYDVRREYTKIEAVLDLPGDRRAQIDRHVRLLDSKVRVGYYLMRVRELKDRLARRLALDEAPDATQSTQTTRTSLSPPFPRTAKLPRRGSGRGKTRSG